MTSPEPLVFERRPPAALRWLPIPAWGLLFCLVAIGALLLSIQLGLWDALEDTLVDRGGLPKSTLIGSLVGLVVAPFLVACAWGFWALRRYGRVELREDVASFRPGLSFARRELVSWERRPQGVLVLAALPSGQGQRLPLLIPTTSEDEVSAALRWLEAGRGGEPTEGWPEQPGALTPPPLVRRWARWQIVFALLPPLVAGLRFGPLFGAQCAWLMLLTFVLPTLLMAAFVFRHFVRTRACAAGLLLATRRIDYAELEGLALAEGRLACELSAARERRRAPWRREWVALAESQSESLAGELEEHLARAGRGDLLPLRRELPPWAQGPPPYRPLLLASLALLGLVLAGLLLPQPLYERLGVPLLTYRELELSDDDGHSLTLLQREGDGSLRFLYVGSEDSGAGVTARTIVVRSWVRSRYGVLPGARGRTIDLVQGSIEEASYSVAIPRDATLVTRAALGAWDVSSHALPAALVGLIEAQPKKTGLWVESLPEALEPLLADLPARSPLRDFVSGRTSWRRYVLQGPRGDRLLALVINGSVEALVFLRPDEEVALSYTAWGGSSRFNRTLRHGDSASAAATITRSERGKLCWIDAQTGRLATAQIGVWALDTFVRLRAEVEAGAPVLEALRRQVPRLPAQLSSSEGPRPR